MSGEKIGTKFGFPARIIQYFQPAEEIIQLTPNLAQLKKSDHFPLGD